MASSEQAQLESWLRATPRGPGRYRTDELRCASVILDEKSEKSIKGDPLETCFWEGESADRSDWGYGFQRLSLNKLWAAMSCLSRKATFGRKPAGPPQHGDVFMFSDYRGLGAYICYGPSSNLVLIKTGSEYGYCIPMEFCDAPSNYFFPFAHVLHEYALPSPLLLPKSACSRFRHLIEKLSQRQGQKTGSGRAIKGMWVDNCVSSGIFPTFNDRGDDGYFVVDEATSMLRWYAADNILSRYIKEVELSNTSAEIEGEDSGSDEDDEEEGGEKKDDDDDDEVVIPRPKRGRGCEQPPVVSEAALAAVNSASTLHLWIEAHPRGDPTRYRADGKCAFVSLNDSLDMLPTVDILYDEGGGNAATSIGNVEALDKDPHSFLRLSLNKLRAKFPGKIPNEAKRGKTAVGPLQHGDVCKIPSTRRFFEIYVCYGPSDDLALVKTRQDDDYCVPPEFCDAPPKYFLKEEALNIEQAYPVPSLLPLRFFSSIDKNNATLKKVFDELTARSGQPLNLQEEFVFEDFSLWNKQPGNEGAKAKFPNLKSTSPDDEGFLILKEEDGLIIWTGPSSSTRRYRLEVELEQKSAERLKKAKAR